MNQAATGKIALFFVDASHFVMGCDFLGYIYAIARRFVKTYSGRSRYNVLGAINFLTKAVTTITNNTYITATEVCELLKKLSEEYASQAIYLVLDHARYQKCKVVQELASQLKITLILDNDNIYQTGCRNFLRDDVNIISYGKPFRCRVYLHTAVQPKLKPD